MCPIAVMPEGSEVTVAKVAGGGEASRRLSELGIVPGAQDQRGPERRRSYPAQGGGCPVCPGAGNGPEGFCGRRLLKKEIQEKEPAGSFFDGK